MPFESIISNSQNNESNQFENLFRKNELISIAFDYIQQMKNSTYNQCGLEKCSGAVSQFCYLNRIYLFL